MATPRVIRLQRRRTAWEKTDPREVAEIEFQSAATGGFDLKPSVYLLDDVALVVRVRAEHSASFISPPKPSHSTTELDVSGASPAPLRRSPGTTRFAFANAAHAELLLPNEDGLIAFVACLLRERAQRAIEVPASEVLNYVEARFAAGDAEWLSLIAPNGREQGEWAKAIAALRRRRAAGQ